MLGLSCVQFTYCLDIFLTYKCAWLDEKYGLVSKYHIGMNYSIVLYVSSYLTNNLIYLIISLAILFLLLSHDLLDKVLPFDLRTWKGTGKFIHLLVVIFQYCVIFWYRLIFFNVVLKDSRKNIQNAGWNNHPLSFFTFHFLKVISH